MFDNFTILQPEVLTGLITQFIDPEDVPYYDMFAKNNVVQAEMGLARWDEIRGSRDIQDHAGFEAPSKAIKLMGIRRRTAEPARIALNKNIPSTRFSWLREPGKQTRERLERLIGSELQDMKNQIRRTQNKICADALGLGVITISQPSDAQHELYATVSFGTAKLTATASWLTAGTKIITGAGELAKVRKAMQSAAGVDPGLAIGRSDLSRALLANTEIAALLSDNHKDTLFLDHHIRTMDGLTWEYHDNGYKAGETTFTYMWPSSHCTFLPKNYADVLAMLECEECVPNQAKTKLIYVPGLYSYTKIMDDPPAIKLIAGVNYIPVILKPNSVIRYDFTK